MAVSSENGGQVEILRQLRAARDGRFTQNGAGRYVIDGEPRPDRKTREKLIYSSKMLMWSFSRGGVTGIELTEKGRRELEAWEASNGR